MRFNVELTRTISTNVEVDAADADAALEMVNRADYPLPPRDQWDGHKDWQLTVYDDNGEVVSEITP